MPVPSIPTIPGMGFSAGLGGGLLVPVTYTSFTCNLSTVNGTAFISNPSKDLISKIGMKITLNDGTQNLVGWIKAAGTGEGSTEKLSNGTFNDNTTGWAANRSGGGTASTIASSHPADGGQSDDYLIITDTGDCGDYQQATQTLTFPSGGLAKWSFYVKSGTSGNQNSKLFIIKSSGNASPSDKVSTASWVGASGYLTIIDSDDSITYRLEKTSSTDGTMLFDEASLLQVLTPSATGVTIVSTKGGGTFNWTSDGGVNSNITSWTATITET